MTDCDEKKIINEMWKNYGMTFIEYIFLSNFRKNNSHINFVNSESLKEINKKINRLFLSQVILLTSN